MTTAVLNWLAYAAFYLVGVYLVGSFLAFGSRMTVELALHVVVIVACIAVLFDVADRNKWI